MQLPSQEPPPLRHNLLRQPQLERWTVEPAALRHVELLLRPETDRHNPFEYRGSGELYVKGREGERLRGCGTGGRESTDSTQLGFVPVVAQSGGGTRHSQPGSVHTTTQCRARWLPRFGEAASEHLAVGTLPSTHRHRSHTGAGSPITVTTITTTTITFTTTITVTSP
ncbi:hypothetical protein E2C01_011108 [Portunus trituberculatus]|uniref:Uncharacterized protein n=1 Tax=Portunus trituberculatus TaxID=210409 RepID=A0A5B7DA85_PORTR|nr:hypothetical protein [Portunus trituberculatus]